MAEIVLAYCASHAPMMSSARMAAPEEQRNNFFGALDHIRDEAVARGVQACVVLSNEHYTNFFLENFPQICIGLGEKNWGPTEEWLPIDKVWVPGHAGLANHIAEQTFYQGITTHANRYDFPTLGNIDTMYSDQLQKPAGADFWKWIETAQIKL